MRAERRVVAPVDCAILLPPVCSDQCVQGGSPVEEIRSLSSHVTKRDCFKILFYVVLLHPPQHLGSNQDGYRQTCDSAHSWDVFDYGTGMIQPIISHMHRPSY